MDTLELEEKLSIEKDMLVSFKSEMEQIDSKKEELDKRKQELASVRYSKKENKEAIIKNIILTILAIAGVFGVAFGATCLVSTSYLLYILYAGCAFSCAKIIEGMLEINKEYSLDNKNNKALEEALICEINKLEESITDTSLRENTLYNIISKLERKINTNTDNLNAIKYYNNEFETLVEDNESERIR